ncbi:hypothetical protein JRQ81_014381, partial [Phrynocephalus forsythii]
CLLEIMQWQLLGLALCLSLAASSPADCGTQCSLCALHSWDGESSIRPLRSGKK